jgi:putative hydrolase of the HAD superfamily
VEELHPALRGRRAVIFDVGGTLTHPDWPRLAQLGREVAGGALTAEEMERAFKEGLREFDACVRRGVPAPFDATRRNWTFRRMYAGLGLDAETCERLSALLDETHAERHLWCGVDADAGRVLAAVRRAGLRTAVVSNTEDGRLEELLQLVELKQHFEFLLDSFVVGVRKPDPAIFELALSKLGVAPAEAVFVGDSYGQDALPALAAGLGAVLIDPADAHPESVCPRVRALGELVSAEPGAARETSGV